MPTNDERLAKIYIDIEGRTQRLEKQFRQLKTKVSKDADIIKSKFETSFNKWSNNLGKRKINELIALQKRLQIQMQKKISMNVSGRSLDLTRRKLQAVEGQLQGVALQSKKSAGIFKNAWVSAGAKIITTWYAVRMAINFTKEAKNAARDAEETQDKFLTVFSSVRESAKNTATELSKNYGLAQSSAQKLLSNTGDLLVGFNFTEREALDLSKRVNELAVDLVSFSNYEGGAEAASMALTTAMLGETEAAKALGIKINQNDKEFKKQVKTLQQTRGLTETQAKALTILNQAYDQSKKAIGDINRTMEKLANQERLAKEQAKELKEELGKSLIPAFLFATHAALKLAAAINKALQIPKIDKLDLTPKITSEEKRIEYLNAINGAIEDQIKLEKTYSTGLAKNWKDLAQKDKEFYRSKLMYINMTIDALKEQKKAVEEYQIQGETDIPPTDEQIAEKKKLIDQYYSDLKWEASDYHKYRLKMIEDEYQDMKKYASKEIDVEQWKNEQIKRLEEERYKFYAKGREVSGELSIKKQEKPKPIGLPEGYKPPKITEEKDWTIDFAKGFSDSFHEAFMEVSDSWSQLMDNWLGESKNIFQQMAKSFLSAMGSALTELIAKWAITKIFSFIGLPIPTGHSGGTFQNGKKVAPYMGAQMGASFTVPKGFPNDSFPLMVESGEKVNITPAASAGNEARLLKSINTSIQAMNINMITMRSRQDIIEQTLKIENDSLLATVNKAENQKSLYQGL
jgi:hypothetical protein